ncbi:MAG: ABC transporter permease [Acholeplasmatales bacterium]|jgi:spermidine/putrescine transport system permease protein|nr:ABC transporter permease [Acholeplasmatales bacterium]
MTQVIYRPKKSYNFFNLAIAIPYFLILGFLVLVPMGLLVVYSFARMNSIGFGFTFTLNNYTEVFRNKAIFPSLGRSLLLALATTVITLAIGYPLAYIISRQKPSIQKFLILLINAPMWVNLLLKIIAIKQLFSIFDPEFNGSNFGVLFGMVYLYLPFMVLPIYNSLSKLDNSYFEGASDLGASKLQTISRVIVPLSMGGVLSGIAMVLLPAATTMTIGKLLGTNSLLIGNVVEIAIKSKMYGGYGFGAAISLMIAIVMMLMVFLFRKLDRGNVDEKE